MNNQWVAPLAGLIVLGIGIGFLRWNRSEWKREKNDSGLDEFDRRHYHARYRRRMQTSAILMLLGILIPIGDRLIVQKVAPGITTVFWLGVLALLFWVVVLAFGDMAATRAHAHVALSRVRLKQQELEKRANELRNQSRESSRGRPEWN